MKPIIGITCNYSYNGSVPCAEGIGAAGQEWQMLADDYVISVLAAGGLPVLLPILPFPGEEDALAAASVCNETTVEMLRHIDGLLLSGGNDLDSVYFDQFPRAEVGPIVAKRDRQEILTARFAYEKMKLPVLGVCRGAQILNVAMGGTLHQHLPAAGFNSHSLFMFPREEPSHSIRIESGSRLGEILGASARVNSFHHQAVNQPAPGFHATAFSPDGVIEAIEPEESGGRFVMGVQWHPEMMAAHSSQQHLLIKAFVSACKKDGGSNPVMCNTSSL